MSGADEALAHLARRARAAASAQELAFLVCNESRALLTYRVSALLVPAAGGRWRLHTHSGLATLTEQTPYRLWIERWVAALAPRLDALLVVTPEMLPPALSRDWAEWLPAGVALVALRGPDRELAAIWMLARDAVFVWPPADGTPEARLAELVDVYGHAWWAWHRRRCWVLAGASRWLRWGALGAVVVLALPVRESALAPAEVSAVDAQVVTAPQDGAVRAMMVPPNAAVKAGDLLFELDQTVLTNRRGVVAESLRTARADLLQAEQKAFDDLASRSELAVLRGKVAEREAEMQSVSRQLERLQVRAPADGLFLYGDQSDWVGRPVQTGERVGLLADPSRLGVTAWLPVSDAINLEPGARLTLYLRVAPLAPVEGRLTETSYHALVSPEGVAGYRVRGELLGDLASARVGLKGTAKVYGQKVPLAYLLFRRPLAALRSWCGC